MANHPIYSSQSLQKSSLNVPLKSQPHPCFSLSFSRSLLLPRLLKISLFLSLPLERVQMISSGQFSFFSQQIVRNVHGSTHGTQSCITGDGFPRYLCHLVSFLNCLPPYYLTQDFSLNPWLTFYILESEYLESGHL